MKKIISSLMFCLLVSPSHAGYFETKLTTEESMRVENIDKENLAVLDEIREGKKLLLIMNQIRIPVDENNPDAALKKVIEDLDTWSMKGNFNAVMTVSVWPLTYQGGTSEMNQEEWERKKAVLNPILKELHKRGILTIWYFHLGGQNVFTSISLTDTIGEDELQKTSSGKIIKSACFNSEKFRERMEKVITKVFTAFDFDGIYFEEPGYFRGGFCHCDNCRNEFRKFLIKKYGSKKNAEEYFGISIDKIEPVKEADRFKNRKLWYEWFRFCQYSVEDVLATVAGYAQQASMNRWGKDIITMGTVGYDGVLHPYAGIRQTEFLNRQEITGMNNALYWQDFDYAPTIKHTSFKKYHQRVKFCKGQSRGKPVVFWIVSKNEPGWVYEIETYDSLLAGIDGFVPYALCLLHVGDGYKKASDFISDNMEFLSGVQSLAEVAILNSYEQTNYEYFGCSKAYDYIGKHIWPIFHTLADLHIPTDYITEPTKEELGKYKVLILDEIRDMKKEEADLIREWVQKGGTLIATGDISSRNIYEEKYPKPLLSDMLGIESESIPVQENSLLLLGGKPATINYGNYLPTGYGIINNTLCQEGYRLSPDKNAKVIAVWAKNRAPAVISNSYGRGRVIYSGAFFQFMKDSSLINSLIEERLNGLPCYTNLPSAADINLLKKDKYLFVHLLNLEEIELKNPEGNLDMENIKRIEKAKPITDVKVSIKIPEGFAPKKAFIISPDSENRKSIDFTLNKNYIDFALPQLDFYNVIVITADGT